MKYILKCKTKFKMKQRENLPTKNMVIYAVPCEAIWGHETKFYYSLSFVNMYIFKFVFVFINKIVQTQYIDKSDFFLLLNGILYVYRI